MNKQSSSEQSAQQSKSDGENFRDGKAYTDASTLQHRCTPTLQDMIEDCLLEIFSVKSLDLMDLCSLAETCKRFRSVIRRFIGKNACFTSFECNYQLYSPKKFDYVQRENGTEADILRIFRNFGSVLSEVRIGVRKVRQDWFLLSLVKKYCDEEVKLLDINRLQISTTLMDAPVFSRLHTLRLYMCSIEGRFHEIDSLVELELVYVQNCSAILESSFPKLEQFSYYSSEVNKPPLETLQAFITSHSALKVLGVAPECDPSLWNNFLQSICNSCTDLQKLDIYNTYDHNFDSSIALKPLQSLISLKTIELGFMKLENFEVFSHLTELRTLDLKNCKLPIDVDQFAYLSQLTKLFLKNCESSSRVYDVAGIIRHLVNLVTMKINYLTFNGMRFALDATSFSRIVRVVKGRTNILKLLCRCDSTVEQFDNQNVQLIRLKSKRRSE